MQFVVVWTAEQIPSDDPLPYTMGMKVVEAESETMAQAIAIEEAREEGEIDVDSKIVCTGAIEGEEVLELLEAHRLDSLAS